MSQTDQSVETWQEIEDLVGELTSLAKDEISVRQFYGELLRGAVGAVGAMGGAGWLVQPDDQLELGPQVNLASAIDPHDAASHEQHQRLLQSVVQSGNGACLLPGADVANGELANNPTESLLIIEPVMVDDSCVAVVELFQEADKSPAVQRGNRQLISVLCEVSADFHRNWQLRRLRDRDRQWDDYEQFLWQVHNAGLDVNQVAYAIANEGRRLIDCDRVSVLVCRRDHCVVRSISGLESIDNRSTVVRQMQNLSQVVASSGEPIWYDGETILDGDSVHRALRDFVSETRAEWLGVLPLVDTAKDAADQGDPVGVLIVEHFSSVEDSDRTVQRTSAITRHATAALRNASDVANMPLIHFSRFLANLRWLTRLRQLPRTLIAVAVLFIIAALLVVVPADFYVEARGELQPVFIETVFAPHDGNVESLPLSANRLVTNLSGRATLPLSWIHASLAGTPWVSPLAATASLELVSEDLDIELDGVWTAAGNVVAVLHNSELQYELTTILGEIHTADTELATVLTTLTQLSGRRSTAEEDAQFRQMSAKRVELQAGMDSLEKRLTIVREQIASLTLRSSLDGQVQTWDVVRKLQSRPVRQGQQLMTIVNPHGGWTVDAYVPDHHIGFVNAARAQTDADLDVSFIVKSDPNVTHRGHLHTVAMATEIHETYGPSVLASVSMLQNVTLNQPRPGTTVVAKIHCGRASIGYVWLHDLIETMRMKLFF